MKLPRLLILSDLWGAANWQWLSEYTKPLSSHFEIICYDIRTLAKIDLKENTEAYYHQNFINGGIETAVEQLLLKEHEPCRILAFSMGGTIAWKFAQQSKYVKHIWAISATRLRYETQLPLSNIWLCYGQKDPNKPANEWFDQLTIQPLILENASHTVYRTTVFAAQIVTLINNSSKKLLR